MSLVDLKQVTERTIRLMDLPPDYDKQKILNVLKFCGDIEDTLCGFDEMLVTFSDATQKEMSKMYEGCEVQGFKLKIFDTEDLMIQVPRTVNKRSEEKSIEYNNNSTDKSNSSGSIQQTSSEKLNSVETIEDEMMVTENISMLQSTPRKPRKISLGSELEKVNLPIRKSLGPNDDFWEVTSINFLTIFSIVWGLIFFLKSLL